MLQNGEAITVTGDGLKPVASGLAAKANPKTQIRRGAVVRLIKGAKGDWSLTQLPEVEGAFVALDPRTGAVRAMVGGFDYCEEQVQPRHAGVAPAGLELQALHLLGRAREGLHAGDRRSTTRRCSSTPASTGSQPWEPKNYDGTFDGPMSLRRGLAKSKNMISIRILQSIGPPYAQQWITRFGFDADKHPAYLTMALGAGSVTPLQMASALQRVRQRRLSRQPDADQPHHRHRRAACCNEAQPPALDESMRTIDARNAFVMTSLLQEVTRSGTAATAQAALKRARHLRQDRHHQRLAGRLVRRLAARTSSRVVWMGYDTPRKLGDRETGGGLALPVWIDYMSTALKGVPVAGADAARGRGQRRRRVVLRGVRARRRRQQPRPRGQGADRRRARKSATASSTCSSAELAVSAGRRLERKRPAGLLAGAGRQRCEELAAVSRVEPAAVDVA